MWQKETKSTDHPEFQKIRLHPAVDLRGEDYLLAIRLVGQEIVRRLKEGDQ
ncbi:hypothetical protein [Cohaesibacter intestini]|uniref:hypothetical protein n=1 Tax=Cohaesibacter intestini TaxID=2211145 RepID=UPI0013009A01|nr:hypothetical protein [Cohaesibacter intestini]